MKASTLKRIETLETGGPESKVPTAEEIALSMWEELQVEHRGEIGRLQEEGKGEFVLPYTVSQMCVVVCDPAKHRALLGVPGLIPAGGPNMEFHFPTHLLETVLDVTGIEGTPEGMVLEGRFAAQMKRAWG